MKTIDAILAEYKSDTLDGRDLYRLVKFLSAEQATQMGLKFITPEAAASHTPVEMTREAVLEELQGDLAFAFEKALGRRGISASLMYEVIKMWLWILEHPLYDLHKDDKHYAQYGLPLLKQTAVAFDLPNPIGDDEGWEAKYESEFHGY